MTYLARLAFAAVLLAAPLAAQTVTMPQTVPVAVGRLAVVDMTYDGDDFKYTVPPELDAFREYTTDPKQVRLRVLGYSAGIFRIQAVTCKGGKLSEFGSTAVIVGQPITPPPGPVVPPVNPPVDPPPAPIAGMRVLILQEKQVPLPKEINDAINSPVLDEYFRLKCLKGPTGVAEVRREDDDSTWDNMPKAWQDLRAKLPAQLPLNTAGVPIPHVAIGDSSGAVVSSGPFPANEAAALAFFKQFGGN